MTASANGTVAMLSVAPNGARRLKRDHPGLPLTPAELATTAAQCLEAGASLLHVHVRDAGGHHLLDPDAYREAFRAIRRAVGDRLVLQATTEAVGRYRPQQQRQLIRELQPEAVSIAVRELQSDGDERANAQLFRWAAEHHIMVQFIVYDDADRRALDEMVARGVVPWLPRWVLHVLGQYSPAQDASPGEVSALAQAARGPWVVCAFGPRELDCARQAIEQGGHVRVGFENNILDPSGERLATNAEQLRAIQPALEAAGRQPASAYWLRGHWCPS